MDPAKSQKTATFLANALGEGWCPYYFYSSNEASTEATAWAAIAMAKSEPLLAKKAIEFLIATQNKDGGWSSGPGMGKSDWTSGPATLAIRLGYSYNEQFFESRKIKQVLIDAFFYLLKARVEFLFPAARLILFLLDGPSGQHYGRGWPWMPGCYNWVEPTAYSLMAVKLPVLIKEDLAKPAVYHANKFLLEHSCRGGGWNHGAFFCLGQFYKPYITTTAEALLALVDIPKDKNVQAGLEYLSKVSHDVPSAMSLAWTILALDAYGRECGKELKMLMELQNEDGSFGMNYFVTAISFLALNTANGINPFKLSYK